MAEEETPLSKVTLSGFMGLETTGDERSQKDTTVTPSPIITRNAFSNEQVPSQKRIPDQNSVDVRSRLQYSSRDVLDMNTGSASDSGVMRSLFSASGTPSSTPQTSLLSNTQELLKNMSSLTQNATPVTSLPVTSFPLGGDSVIPAGQSIPSSSGTITVQENHLLELLKLVGESSQPLPHTPPTAQPNQDWLSQLVNVLKPTLTPSPPPPPPTLGAMEPLMALMVEQLKKQQPHPKPTPPPNPARELLKMLKVLSGEEPGEQRRVISIPKSAVKSRFCDWIAEYPFPDGQKVPLVVGTYDGTKDPEDHLALYDQAILTEKWVDPVACHLFPGTLQGHARDWFTGLPEKSIKDFQDLKEKFTGHFFQQKKHQRNHLEAYLIRQKENESLHDFILRFTQECQKIPGLPESQQISGFTLALHPGPLQEKLTTKVPKTFKEAIDRAYDYLRSRETASLVRGVTKKEKSLGGGSFDREGGRHDSHDRQDRREKRFSPYDKNALTKCPREILSTEKVCATFKPPSPMTFKSGKKNMDEYCEFHEEYGHDTNACKQLKLAINKAVNEGKLEHLVPGAKEGRKAEAKKTFAWQKKGKDDDDDPGPAEGHVCMIMEGEQIHKGIP